MTKRAPAMSPRLRASASASLPRFESLKSITIVDGIAVSLLVAGFRHAVGLGPPLPTRSLSAYRVASGNDTHWRVDLPPIFQGVSRR